MTWRRRRDRWFGSIEKQVPLVRYLRGANSSAADASAEQPIDDLTAKLWGGYSEYAADALRMLSQSKAESKAYRIAAALELARFFSHTGQHEEVLALIRFMEGLGGWKALARTAILMEIDSHLELGQVDRAAEAIARAVKHHGYDTDLSLLAANTLIRADASRSEWTAADTRRLEHINRIYDEHGFLPLAKIDERRPLAIDNIVCVKPAAADIEADPKISVLIPSHNAADSISFALAGLSEQTWRNLEIIVVDDESADRTCELVADFAARDARVRLVRLDENLGAYNARNKGLAIASGDYITVHDADDWSHAQKLEAQMRYLQNNQALGCMSNWVRVTHDLRFRGGWRPVRHLCIANYSSLLLPTDVVRKVGGWDPVRVGADDEFIERMGKKFGKRPRAILKQIPLSFALLQEESLTRRERTHIRTYHFGVRRDYRLASSRWHDAAAASGDFRIDPNPDAVRKFPAPSAILAGGRTRGSFDAVVIADFAEPGTVGEFALAAIMDRLAQGQRVGIFHWPRHDRNILRKMGPEVAALVDGFKIELLSTDQMVEAKTLMIFGTAILRHKLDAVPKVAFDKMYVADIGADKAEAGPDEKGRIRRNLESLFGSAGEWISADNPMIRAGAASSG